MPVPRWSWFALGLVAAGGLRAQPSPWQPDRGDGTYRNPVLCADYSDPDAVRVGDDFYLVSSSFHCVPGLPILHSRDLVNWTIIGHALPLQPPVEHFSVVRHGEGAWAPSIRHHAGRFWIYYPDPDFGIYLVTATDPAGPWSQPVLVLRGRGLIDPCPLWDDDGQLYLVHGWAKSRAGINNRLTINRLSADGRSARDAGTVVVDADRIPGWTTLEGPKLYKRHGYYYIFAPAGGVTQGYQAVFRSRRLYGPYEHRIVLEQGATPTNGPHQGAWVDTASGEDWFLHFQDRGAFGRVVHLEPMAWRRDEWPVMGDDATGSGRGTPVAGHRKPAVGAAVTRAEPQTSDDFASPTLGLQWQWNANPRGDWASLTERPGALRLACLPAPAPDNLYNAPALLLQKFPAPAFTATTRLELEPAADGASAGLIVFGYDYAWIGLEAGRGLVERRVLKASTRRPESTLDVLDPDSEGPVFLRVTVDAQALARFSYSHDGVHFQPAPRALTATVDRWIGAKVGLFASAHPRVGLAKAGQADFEWFRVTP
jgi:beta-xylosidase